MTYGAIRTVIRVLLCTFAGTYIQAHSFQSPLLPDFQSNDSISTSCHSACTSLVRDVSCSVAYDSVPPIIFEDFYSLQQREVVPACVVFPTSAQDVSEVIQIIRQHSCIFAVKSGGHAFFAGASNAPGGITVDLKYLNGIEVIKDETGEMTTWVGTGNRWKDVYEKLHPLNIAVVGGRDKEVGVGGFLLGGGISFMSRRHGWGFDNVKGYEVVLSNGTITNVTLSSHPDLYFALRGGGNNFGIVARFELDTYPQGLIWGGITMHFLSDVSSRLASFNLNRSPTSFKSIPSYILETFSDWVSQIACQFGFCTSIEVFSQVFEKFNKEGGDDKYAQVFTWNVLVPSLHVYMVGGIISNGRPEAHPPAFESFRKLTKRNVYNSVRVKSLKDWSAELGGKWSPAGFRQVHVSTTFRLDSTVIEKANDIWMMELEPIRDVKGLLPSLMTQMISQDEIKNFAKRGGNSVGVAPDEGPLIMISAVIRWSEKADDELVLGAAKNCIARIEQFAREKEVHHRFIYQNYAAEHQDVFAGYGAENRERLREISRRYDPEGVFSRLQPGYFKL